MPNNKRGFADLGKDLEDNPNKDRSIDSNSQGSDRENISEGQKSESSRDDR